VQKELKVTSAQIRAVGEHYVMARLLALGHIVGIAPDNTRSVDLIAMREDGSKHFQIQVKTRTRGRSSDEGWHMKDKHEEINTPGLHYVFVALPENWTDRDQPETFIIPSAKVAEILKDSHRNWLSTPGAKGQKRRNSKMRRILPKYKDSPEILSGWMEEFRDNWMVLA